ncbi:hypothetical protein P691DRAFT_383059 [Macrolepiota fuliginosa MF-IS2]|uniref:Uncharacterized protein n=1 Tax=Macrolepiota fuliginosa MF-IS2 TaxID=1400762 RepID=A0A9P5X537_9AGAR|nr:hypothetical protein P691DRAFT_383059 [Macrolepiota fuliginosa MF-IS2]
MWREIGPGPNSQVRFTPDLWGMESMSNQLTFLIGFWSERSLAPEHTYITATGIYLEYTGCVPNWSGEPYDDDDMSNFSRRY